MRTVLGCLSDVLASGQPQPGVSVGGTGPGADTLSLVGILILFGVVVWLMVTDKGDSR